MCIGRRFFVTDKGYFGLAPHFATEGDLVCVLFGARVPFVLRPCMSEEGKPRRFKLVGPAYLEGAMIGEALVNWKEGILKHEEIILI